MCQGKSVLAAAAGSDTGADYAIGSAATGPSLSLQLAKAAMSSMFSTRIARVLPSSTSLAPSG